MAQAARNQFLADVAANIPLCQDHYRLVLRVDGFPASRPGQFFQIASDVPSTDDGRVVEWMDGTYPHLRGAELAEARGFLRRPFSLGGRRDLPGGLVELDIIYRVVGVSTNRLIRLQAGDRLSILGPLGNGFRAPGDDGIAILVGGGVGIPPMIYLAAELTGRKAVAFAGAVTRDLLPLTVMADAVSPGPDAVEPLYNIDEFARHGMPAIIATDDGTYGFRGYVTQALEAYLDRYILPRHGATARAVIYTCGPEVMMRRVADIAIARGIACQVSVERAMACGMGTCQSCCIKVKKPDPAAPPLAGSDWCYRLACTDGPIFEASQLLW